jgi:hypothetical protein
VMIIAGATGTFFESSDSAYTRCDSHHAKDSKVVLYTLLLT